MGRRFCVGDIHGCYDELMTVLDNCNFSESDILYSVGDFTDRGKQNVKVLDFLMGLSNFKPCVGNHDLWNYEHLHPAIAWEKDIELPNDAGEMIKSHKKGTRPYMSLEAEKCWYVWNGGRETLREEADQSQEWRDKVYNFLKDLPYRINLGDKIIIHSTCPLDTYRWVDVPLDEITTETLKSSGLIVEDVYDDKVWDRWVIKGCKDYVQLGNKYPSFDLWAKEKYGAGFTGNPIYIIGHTPLAHPFYDKDLGIVGIDTGAFCNKKRGWDLEGYLTVLDTDTFEYWTSDSKEKKHLEAT